MKLILERWRKFLKEDTRAFHGYGMNPAQMRVKGCEGGDPSADAPNDQWSTGEEGCPKFSDNRNVNEQHPDIIEAIKFLDAVQPKNLIAYSRGGAIASLALSNSNHQPVISFVAPAWKRGWVSANPLPPQNLEGTIVHGTRDNAVPLRQSFELAAETGMPLYVIPGANHINILKYRSTYNGGSKRAR